MDSKNSLDTSRDRYDEWHGAASEDEHASIISRLHPWHNSVLNLLPDLNDCNVLEIGCGRGDFSRELARRYPGVRVFGVDFSEKAIEIATRRSSSDGASLSFSVGNAESLPFKINTFDWIISCECLEHVPSPQAMASEMFRTLRPGGHFVLTTENYFNGMVLAWLNCYLKGIPFDSGAGVQPVEHFFLFFQVHAILRRAGFAVQHTESNHYQWLLLPRVDPAKLCTENVHSPFLRRLLLPFGRHFTYAGIKPPVLT